MLNSQPETFFITQLEPMSRGTRAHQLAMYVVYESPLQMLSDSPSKYDENPESLRFLEAVPTVWDETVPLSGDIRRNVAVARRSGETWYVGVLGGTDAQQLEIDLSFLGGGDYVMEEWRDGVNAGVNGKDCRYTRSEIEGGGIISVSLARGGGYAAIFTPKN
jgi:alpha-glucosidase